MIAYVLPAFVLGALSSAHCIGMCGPIALAVPSSRSSVVGRLGDALLLNGGRVSTYMLIGGLFGFFGRGVHLAGLQQGLSITVGVLMLIAVALPAVFRRDLFSGRAVMHIGRLRGMLAHNLRRTSPEGLFLTGLLNGLLPCGMVYFALAGALVQDGVVAGSLFMLAFGLGTWPALVAVRLGGGLAGTGWRSGLRRMAPYVFAIMGTLFVLRGLGLGIPYVSPRLHEVPLAVQACH